MHKTSILIASLLVSAQLTALAAAPRPSPIAGTIVSATDKTVVVDTAYGQKTISYGPSTRFFGIARSSLDKVTAGSFIGTTVAPKRDGTFVSTEVHIFAPSLRGTGEGFSKMDDRGRHMMANSTVRSVAPVRMMANSTVKTVNGSAGEKTITMVFPSGTKTITIPSNVPVVYIEPGTTAMLARGAHVQAAALSTPHGLSARFLLVGEHGIVPPM